MLFAVAWSFGIWGHIYTGLNLVAVTLGMIYGKEAEPSVARTILLNLSLFAVILFWVLPI